MSDKPKFVTNCTPLYIAGGFATIIAAAHHPEGLAIKLDHEHPESPNAPTNPAQRIVAYSSASLSATTSFAPLFDVPGSK